jgi:glucokinase
VEGVTVTIGIDIGGTKIAAAAVDPATGRIVDKRVVRTEPERGGTAVLESCVSLARLLAEGRSVERVGVGICEIVDPRGEIASDVTIKLRGLPVVEAFAGIAPAVLESDVRAAARAEALVGAGRGLDTFLYVSIGSGIGACFVQDGVPLVGKYGRALIVGVAPSPIEDTASGPAIAAACALPDAEAVLRAAGDGDAHAERVVRDAARSLGMTIACLANLLDPDAIVIGGGLGLAPGPYWDSLVPAIAGGIWRVRERDVAAIVKAELGEDAGVIGAALACSA